MSEAELAKKLGLPRKTVREARRAAEMMPEADYTPGHRPIAITPAGEKKLLAAFGIPPGPENSPAAATEAAAAGPAATFELEVTGAPNRNTRLLLARHPGGNGSGEPLRVRVRNNKNYTAGMRIAAAHETGQIYVALGRAPRWKGKW